MKKRISIILVLFLFSFSSQAQFLGSSEGFSSQEEITETMKEMQALALKAERLKKQPSINDEEHEQFAKEMQQMMPKFKKVIKPLNGALESFGNMVGSLPGMNGSQMHKGLEESVTDLKKSFEELESIQLR